MPAPPPGPAYPEFPQAALEPLTAVEAIGKIRDAHGLYAGLKESIVNCHGGHTYALGAERTLYATLWLASTAPPPMGSPASSV
jgi:hypothetical protein